jgi:ribonuclease P protein component
MPAQTKTAKDINIGRLKRRSDFLAVQAAVQKGTGRKWVASSMVVQIGPSPGPDPRFGLTVTKKTAASAVIRNRIRRRLREAAFKTLPDYPAEGWDLVLIGRLSAADIPYEQLLKDLSWCLKRLDLGQSVPELQAGPES